MYRPASDRPFAPFIFDLMVLNPTPLRWSQHNPDLRKIIDRALPTFRSAASLLIYTPHPKQFIVALRRNSRKIVEGFELPVASTAGEGSGGFLKSFGRSDHSPCAGATYGGFAAVKAGSGAGHAWIAVRLHDL